MGDDAERVTGALSKKIKAPFCAIEAKAKAFEVGFQFGKDFRIREFIIEGDSLVLGNALQEYPLLLPLYLLLSMV